MSDTTTSSRLWDLLPAVLRGEDMESGGVLQALLAVISGDVDAEERQIWGFYDDLFIETCDDWVVPYIGELVANDLLYDASRHDDARTATELFADLAPNDLRAPVAARARADVARTIYYRRRKGTPAMLEELARNVTGWPVHLVECFELLDWPQHLTHLRRQAALLDVRSPERCERAVGAFSDAVRTVDVRLPRLGGTHGSVVAAGVAGVSSVTDDPVLVDSEPTDPVTPPYHPRTAAFFAWRLQASPLVWLQPKASATCAFGWSFSPLGNPSPLFSRWRREGDESGLATEWQVPQPIRRTFFAADLDAYRDTPPTRPPFTRLYGEFADPSGASTELAPEDSVAVFRNGQFVGPTIDPTSPVVTFAPQVTCMRLDPWPAVQPAGAVVGIDVVTGRLVLGTGFTGAGDPTTDLAVAYHPGQAAGHGGGGYDRSAWLVPAATVIGTASLPILRFTVGTRPRPPTMPAPDHPTVTAAIQAWVNAGRPPCVIRIEDSGTYALPSTTILEDGSWLVIEAANGERPHLRTVGTGWKIDVTVPPGDRDRQATLTLSGLLVEGWVDLVGELARLRLWHTTLVPGRSLDEDGTPATRQPSVVAEPAVGHTQLRIEIAFSILGPIRAPAVAEGVWLLDSVVDGMDFESGAPAPFGGPALVGPTGGLDDPGPPLVAERSTVIGGLHVARLEASEVIVTGPVTVQRTQEGCVRFSYVADGSVTPRRYRCQPEMTADAAAAAAVRIALAADPTLSPLMQAAVAATARATVVAALVPAFTSRGYGHPAYGQLHRSTPPEITRGAEDGSEMGALCHLKQSQREDNLRLRLAEYLPFGLDPALVYVT